MEYLKLIGIVLIIIGFALKIDSSAVVVIAAVATAAVSGLDINQILTIMGKGFMENRMISLFFLTLPMIGIMERHGLRVEAARLVKKLKSLTPGKICDAYTFIREIGCAAGIQLQGQVQFIRPLVCPMAIAAAKVKQHKITRKQSDGIKSLAAADENLSNFFSQDLSIVAGGSLLIASSMKSIGYPIDITETLVYSIPSAIIILILVVIYNYIFDKRLQK